MVLFAALGGCSPTPPPRPVPPPPPVVVAPPPRPLPPPPAPNPPNSSAPDLVIPPTDGLGRRMTPNVDLSAQQALWQLRIGLNVAALNCRGPDEAILVSNYSRFLTTNRAAIARAERAVIADQARIAGTNGVAQRDTLSTRLYNYFAQPPVVQNFCARATSITAMAAAEPGANILNFATTQLPQLDQPFVDFYAAYAQYQTSYAVWYASYGGQIGAPAPGAVPVAVPVPVPVPSVTVSPPIAAGH